MATNGVDALQPAVDNLQINGDDGAPDKEVSSTGTDLFDFPLEETYRLALRFYKEKEGTKAFQLSYKDKVKFVAYTKQVMHGKYRPDGTPEVGFLDVVGNDRRQAWLALGDMTKDSAMTEFVKYLDSLCPLFKPYVEAHKAEKEEQAARQKEEEEQQKRDQVEKERNQLEAEVQQRQEDERNRQLQQEMAIRAALNQQTAIQFKQYAEQQYPGNTQQQEALIIQLQEQHFQQYMQQVYQQQLLHQQQQYQQLQAMSAGPTAPPVVGDGDGQTEQIDGSSSPQSHQVTQHAQAVTGNGVDPKLSPGAQPLPNSTMSSPARLKPGSGDEGDEQDNDDDEETEHSELTSSLPPLVPASIWTKKDLRSFKDLVKGNPDNVIKIGSLATATVRVPTHEDGTCLFWEFATDSYDIGFGVYFEWTISPNNQVSVHVSESSDEEELEEEEGEAKPGVGDLEKGKKPDNRPPTDEIIPVYRRDCHEEVYCGSHMYPGRGVYLLKFDNSYSLWRSKTLYYRVYYTR